MPVNEELIDLASAGDKGAINLMMKWGYEGSKKFIGVEFYIFRVTRMTRKPIYARKTQA